MLELEVQNQESKMMHLNALPRPIKITSILTSDAIKLLCRRSYHVLTPKIPYLKIDTSMI